MKKRKMSGVSDLFLISDIHFGVRNDNKMWTDIITDYFREFFIPLVENNKSDETAVAILGDVFDNRTNLNINTMNEACDIIEKIASMVPVIILVGNHDMYKKRDTTLNSLRVFRGIKNVTIVDEETLYSFNGSDVLMIPYTEDYVRCTKLIEESKADYVFLHTQIKNTKFNQFTRIGEGVDLTNFTGTMCFSGHIHMRSESGKAIYLGSPYHLNRADIGNVKGIYRVDLKTKTHTFTENTVTPVYQKLLLSDVLKMSTEDVKNALRGNFTDILVREDDTDFEPYDFLEAYKTTEYKGVEFIYVNDESEDNPYENIEVTIKDGGVSLDDVVREFIETTDVSEDLKRQVAEWNKRYIDQLTNTDNE